MDPITQQIALASAGAGGADPLYVDDVFSTYLYDGTGAAQTITNGIDLSGEGGLVWLKCRSLGLENSLFDTERGAGKYLVSNNTGHEVTNTTRLSAFNSDGFSLGDDPVTNSSGDTHVSWTFRKAPGFFDIVTYTGDGTSNRAISHSLGSTPGFVIVKRTSSTEDWACWHNSFSAGERILLNTTAAKGTASGFPAVPTSTTFSVGGSIITNGNNNTYVAYLFAHDDQSFGTNSDEAIIKCGSYTGNGTTQKIDLGFEAQWVLIKRTDSSIDWYLQDVMRGMVGNSTNYLSPNIKAAEANASTGIQPDPNGFDIQSNNSFWNTSGGEYIYIAIRRSHKPPEAGTDVLDIIARSGTGSTTVVSGNVEPVDFVITKSRNTTNAPVALTRLLGNYGLETHATTAATTNVLGTSINPWDIQDGIRFTGDGDTNASGGFNYINYFFKRAPGFFDVVTYTGTGSDLTVNHNLGVTPELIICRNRSSGTGRWYVYPGPLSSSEQKHFRLNGTLAVDSNANLDWAPTATTFNADTFLSLSTSGTTYVAYLFATLDGISKVGTYTGTGNTNIDVDCGFTAGARFVLIKRTDSLGSWFLFDTTRGIVAGNDPFLKPNQTATESSADYIDPYNLGFTVTSSAPAALNASGGTYLFLAIA
jgi:hypothetical protein